MANPVGSLVVRIGADLSELKSGVDKAQGHLSKLGTSMRTGINVAAKYAAAMAVAGAAVVAALVTKAFDAIDAQAKLARQLRATNAGLETLTRAGDLAGVEQEKMTMAVKRLDVAIGESIRGTATYKDAFDKLGISAQAISEMDADERVKAINQALLDNVPAAERAQVAGVLFGTRVGQAIASISPDEIARAREEVEKLGLAVSEVDSNTIERMGDDLSTLREVFRGIVNRIAVKLAPIIAHIAEAIKNTAMESRGFEDIVTKAFNGVMKAAGFFGDVIQGLRVTFKGVELVAVGFGAVVASVFEMAINGIFSLAAEVNKAVNDLISGLNKIPKVEIPFLETDINKVGAVRFASDLGEAMRDKVGEVRGELHDLVMQELPSDKIEAFLANVKKAADETSVAAREAQQAMALSGPDASDPEAEKRTEALNKGIEALRESLMTEAELEQKSFADRLKELNDWREAGLDVESEYNDLREKLTADHQARLAEILTAEETKRMEGLTQKLEAFRESLLTESELETAHQQARFEALTEFLENGLITEGEYYKLKEELFLQHQARMSEIERAGLTERQKFERASLKDKAKQVSGHLADITAGVSQHNRKMFELNKAAGIAQAIINAFEGISLTLKTYPYPLNLGMAAAHAAAAFAQVSAIKSSSFGGGSAPSLAGSTPATPVTPVNSGAPSQLGSRQTIAIDGISRNDLFSGDAVRDLIEKLNEAAKDGARLVFV